MIYCSIPIIFAAVAPDIRSSTITVIDDAPDSPQAAVNGTAAQPVGIGAAASGSTSAAVVAARRQHLPRDRNNSHSRKQPHPAYFPQVERSLVHNP
jgi:hypothetical protein